MFRWHTPPQLIIAVGLFVSGLRASICVASIQPGPPAELIEQDRAHDGYLDLLDDRFISAGCDPANTLFLAVIAALACLRQPLLRAAYAVASAVAAIDMGHCLARMPLSANSADDHALDQACWWRCVGLETDGQFFFTALNAA